jgi:hypothetical protein
MRTYTITSPYIDGILSDDQIYFEGVNRPGEIYTIRDSGTGYNIDILEKYFNDLYNLFLRKLSSFAMFENTDDEEVVKMQALLQELVKVKKMIQNASVDTDDNLV